jgi:hypothetical protein
MVPRMSSPTSVEPQPRIDTLVTDAVTGAAVRRTEYRGTAWYGSRPNVGSVMVTTTMGTARIETPFFLPDSLPYRADLAGSAVIVVSVAVQSAADETHQLIDYRATLEPDPRNPQVAWVRLELRAFTWTPTAVSYAVDVLVSPEAVLAAGTPGG